jgi:K+-sensing histidine kinase KdpD
VTCELGNTGLTLTVRDSGAGISEARLPHVFEPFYHGDRERPVDGGHCGLGLFLVKSHVDALGGTLDVQSTPGAGSTFTARLPRAAITAAPAAAGADTSAADSVANSRQTQGGAPAPLSLSSNGPGSSFR